MHFCVLNHNRFFSPPISSESVVDSLNTLLAKSSVKLKNEELEKQFKADLINKQLKAFDDLWRSLELTESLTELRKQIQEKPKSNAPKWYLFVIDVKNCGRKLKIFISLQCSEH